MGNSNRTQLLSLEFIFSKVFLDGVETWETHSLDDPSQVEECVCHHMRGLTLPYPKDDTRTTRHKYFTHGTLSLYTLASFERTDTDTKLGSLFVPIYTPHDGQVTLIKSVLS